MADRRRTKTEAQANEFDRRLYALISEARAATSGRPQGAKWHETWAHLRSARRAVRDLMHPADRQETVGED